MAAPKRKTKLRLLSGTEVTIYEGPRLQRALEEATSDLTLYQGVKLAQVFEAIYNQGKKDGAKAAFDEVQDGILNAQKKIPHRAPGRPRKAKKTSQ